MRYKQIFAPQYVYFHQRCSPRAILTRVKPKQFTRGLLEYPRCVVSAFPWLGSGARTQHMYFPFSAPLGIRSAHFGSFAAMPIFFPSGLSATCRYTAQRFEKPLEAQSAKVHFTEGTPMRDGSRPNLLIEVGKLEGCSADDGKRPRSFSFGGPQRGYPPRCGAAALLPRAAHADRGAVVGIDFAAVAAFELSPEMERAARVEVGAQPVLVPRAAEVFRQRARNGTALAEAEVRFALPVVRHGSLQEGRPAVVRALRSETESRTADERVGRSLIDPDVRRRGVVRVEYVSVPNLDSS